MEEQKYLTEEQMREFQNPPLGTIVHWFPRAEKNSRTGIPAMIVAHEGPGIVSLNLFKRLSNVQQAVGVRYIADPFHKPRNKEATMNNGGWDFAPTFRPPIFADAAVAEVIKAAPDEEIIPIKEAGNIPEDELASI